MSLFGARLAHLPSGGAVAVPLVLEIGNVVHHPLVDLAERQPLLRGRVDGLRDQVGIAHVAPRVAAGGALLAVVVGAVGAAVAVAGTVAVAVAVAGGAAHLGHTRRDDDDLRRELRAPVGWLRRRGRRRRRRDKCLSLRGHGRLLLLLSAAVHNGLSLLQPGWRL